MNIIDRQLLSSYVQDSENKGLPLGDILTANDAISEDNLGKIIADLIHLPFVNLMNVAIDDTVLKTLPEQVAKKQGCIIFKQDNRGIHLATTEPANNKIIALLQKKTGQNIIVYYTTQQNINSSLLLYQKNIVNEFDEMMAKNIAASQGNSVNDPPIINMVNVIIMHAYQYNASDIHIERQADKTLIRFRIDGILHDIITIPGNLNDKIVSRIKVMSNLRIDEHQNAQDGKIIFDTGAEALDIRVSIAPIISGEKIVLRLLSEKSRHFSLPDMGLNEQEVLKLKQMCHLPHGMILATGPTGAGKTTTLYALIKLINNRGVNIMTIEDPVEYQIEDINQMQVNQQAGLTFADGLRSIVRQDPDVILVGEIRDEETAGITVNSAMTGHLVLSSLHTNDAVTTFPRLIDMGLEPYIIASSVNVVLAQRLVRKICSSCKMSVETSYDTLDNNVRKYITPDKTFHSYIGKGCSVCRQTGYRGRTGIFEMIIMNDELNRAICDKQSARQLYEIALRSGMRPMFADGIDKVKTGVTTLEEVIRVTKE